MTRAELIAALEAATGPSRELDVYIHCLKNPSCKPYDLRLGLYVDKGFRGGTRTESAPDFTESLDAALTLVRDYAPWCVGVDQTKPISRCFTATVWTMRKMGDCEVCENAVNPAIAICSAALRAREGKDG